MASFGLAGTLAWLGIDDLWWKQPSEHIAHLLNQRHGPLGVRHFEFEPIIGIPSTDRVRSEFRKNLAIDWKALFHWDQRHQGT